MKRLTHPCAVFADAAELREHLDELNDSGVRPIAVGYDVTLLPFLVTLVGPYADGVDVFFDSPWQGDVEYGEWVDGEFVRKPSRCDDCGAQSHELKDLRFPVTVLLPDEVDEEQAAT